MDRGAAANFLTRIGALDRLGGFFVLASIREIGPTAAGTVVAGVAGTAITADLGARNVREELDALHWGSVLKTTIFGAIIAIVRCYKGMAASGGAEGVGRAVNEASCSASRRCSPLTTSSTKRCSPPLPRSS